MVHPVENVHIEAYNACILCDLDYSELHEIMYVEARKVFISGSGECSNWIRPAQAMRLQAATPWAAGKQIRALQGNLTMK